MAKNFLKVEASEFPDNLFLNQTFNVLLNLDNVICLEQRKYKNREWYDVLCENKKRYSVTVSEAERISKELGEELSWISLP